MSSDSHYGQETQNAYNTTASAYAECVANFYPTEDGALFLEPLPQEDLC